jgi:hypothetical protein
MTHQKNVPIPAHNQHCQVSKTHLKRPNFLHLTHQMTHGLTHHLGHNSTSVSKLLAEMAVITNMSELFNKNYSIRFLPLSTHLIKAGQMTAYKMAEPIGMAHSLSLNSSTI